MSVVKAKKRLGQHFLKDTNVAERVADSLTGKGYDSVIEIGPGMGVLTRFLMKRPFGNFVVNEIDRESVEWLKENFPPDLKIIEGDFLRLDLKKIFPDKFAIVGNFPYNISSQIFFSALDNRDRVIEVTGMIQKEVAERIAAGPGSKTYGILSVLLQAFFTAEILFTVPPHVFNPPPKVNSAVLRLRRNSVEKLDCDEALFFRVVKAAFNQRRKTLRNSLGAVFPTTGIDTETLSLRAERLSVDTFVSITRIVKQNLTNGKEG